MSLNVTAFTRGFWCESGDCQPGSQYRQPDWHSNTRLDNFWMFQDVKYDYTVDLADTGDRYEYDNESQWRVVEVFQEWYGHWGSSEAATVNIIDLTWLDLRQHTRQNAACTVFAGEDISRLTCPQFEGKMIYAHTPVIYQIYWSQHMSIHSGQQHESHSKL